MSAASAFAAASSLSASATISATISVASAAGAAALAGLAQVLDLLGIEALANPRAKQFDEMFRRRAGSKPELHAVADMLERSRRRLPLQSVHVHVQTMPR